VERDGRWSSDFSPAEMGIPPTVRTIAQARLGALSPAARLLLPVAALAGPSFDVLYVAGAFPCDLDALAAEVGHLEVAEVRGRGHMLTFTAPAEITDIVARVAGAGLASAS
jgi:predicted ATPase